MPFSRVGKTLITLSFALGMSACAVMPKNLDSQQKDAEHHFVRKVELTNTDATMFRKLAALPHISKHEAGLASQLFSRGDWLRLQIQSMPEFDGVYQINTQGELELPFGGTIYAANSNRAALIKQVQKTLFESGWFTRDDTFVGLSLVRAASIDVSVTGAVFNQGRTTINGAPASKQEDSIQQQAGAHAVNRDLVAALAAAGGVRPDANLNNIIIKRKGEYYSVDIQQLVNGVGYGSTPSLVHGDEIYVDSNGVENTALIRPTQVTPPGMRVLMSNLTAPALSNSIAAVGADSTRLPYGASLLDAALSANCVGGTHQANASRSILLITRHYGSKQQIVIRRSINQLLATSSDYSVNPYLMPNDGVACYDSKFTNIRDVARGIGELFGPILLGGIL